MKTSADLGKDPVSSLVLRLAIPAMIAQFVNVLYSIIDRMYIGHIPGTGALALAGVGVCGPIVILRNSCGIRRFHSSWDPNGRGQSSEGQTDSVKLFFDAVRIFRYTDNRLSFYEGSSSDLVRSQ